MNVPRYAKSTPDVTRGLTSDVWQGSLEKYASLDPQFGVRFSDDGLENVIPAVGGTTSATVGKDWTANDAATAGGTYAVSSVAGEPDGVITINSTGTANHQGVEARRSSNAVNLPTHSTDGRGRVCYEVRVDLSTADTVFLGLTEDIAEFLSASSALPTTSDYIGFYTDDNGATLTFVCANDNAGGTAVTGSFSIPAADLVASGYQRLAFAVNRDGSVEIGVNGNYYGKIENGIVSTALPIETLVPKVAATAGGGTTAAAVLVDTLDGFIETITP